MLQAKKDKEWSSIIIMFWQVYIHIYEISSNEQSIILKDFAKNIFMKFLN